MANSTISSINMKGTVYDIEDTTARQVATVETLGLVKPDGTTVTVDSNGTIHSNSGITKFVDVPVASSTDTFTYDGTEKELVFTSLDTTNVNVTGNTATNAGNQTAVCTLKNVQYAWKDLSSAPKSFPWVINKATLTPPTVSGTLTYNGSAQSPTISTYDSTKISITGISATNVGTYTAIIHIIDTDNYKWSDGTIADKTATWSIVKATLTVPTVTDTSKIYTGNAQHPTVTGYDSSTMTRTGYEYTNVGNYTLTFGLVDSDNYEWNSATASFAWSIAKAAGAVILSANSVTLDASHLSRTVTISGATGAITITSSNTSVATVSPASMNAPGGTLTITSPNKTKGTSTVTVNVAASTNYNATSTIIAVTGNFAEIYGVEWDGSSSPIWTRTDAAANFTDPVAAINNGNGSSPFDNISPWKDMVVSERTGGTMVSIPKFYYKWTKTGVTMKLQVSMDQFDGAVVSPAHRDRGDGKGERDIVYVGRYHFVYGQGSITDASPYYNATRANFRSYIHSLGNNIWQWDYAMLTTIWILYLVEYANWNSQEVIGGGGGGNNAKTRCVNNGKTDEMIYHTGTTSVERLNPRGHIQYRHIEDLWANVYDWVDGIYYIYEEGSSWHTCIIMNPANFSDSTGGTIVAPYQEPTDSNNGYISEWDFSSVSGFDWFMYPIKTSGSYNTYVTDTYTFRRFNGSGLFAGGGYDGVNYGHGLFNLHIYTDISKGTSYESYIGSRIQELP